MLQLPKSSFPSQAKPRLKRLTTFTPQSRTQLALPQTHCNLSPIFKLSSHLVPATQPRTRFLVSPKRPRLDGCGFSKREKVYIGTTSRAGHTKNPRTPSLNIKRTRAQNRLRASEREREVPYLAGCVNLIMCGARGWLQRAAHCPEVKERARAPFACVAAAQRAVDEVPFLGPLCVAPCTALLIFKTDRYGYNWIVRVVYGVLVWISIGCWRFMIFGGVYHF